MPILDHFGWIAPYYDRLASEPDVSIWRELLRLPAQGRLLDAGGGTGRLSSPLAADVNQVVLADPAWKMAEQARQKGVLTPLVCEAEALPFASGSFARVMMVDAFHHVRDQALVSKELLRVLAPGGRLVIVEPDIDQWGVKVVALMEKLLLMRSHFLRGQQIRALYAGSHALVELRSFRHNMILTIDAQA
jgi:demethylmenaquinone methyltransferase/2-methoxy-6-polyprenyl-1,4-benzoquinol methylase